MSRQLLWNTLPLPEYVLRANSIITVIVFTLFRHQVYYEVPALQQPKTTRRNDSNIIIPQHESRFAHNWQRVKTVVSTSAGDFGLYFKHPAFLPSFSGALLYLTVLSFAGQMVTYLVSAGYSSMHIGIARALSVASEVLATWVAPCSWARSDQFDLVRG